MNSSLLSAFMLLYWFMSGTPSFVMKFKWLYWGLQNFTLSIMLDFPFVMFSAVGLFVTWSMIEFSHYYMEKDPSKKAFMSTLILFLLFMLLLVTSKSLFLLFVGWEGVGMMSFILMGWWFTRADAKSSALQAMIYNRMGDSGMILFMMIMMSSNNSWKLKEILFLKKSSPAIKIAMLGVILAAVGKSAQFSLHPWLPAAMEGPTPVSALLHSSTMVVAGVFLLFRCSALMNNFSWALTLIALMGAITALFAASVALTQYDMKKMMAYSTTSQLGLMVVALGVGAPKLALFHICTHAFFKALLFLCSGSIIHSFKKEQDIRKMGKASASLPLTTSCVIMASLALSGLPFLAGYYSKDVILEASQMKISKSVSVMLALLATMMTAMYSTRMIFFVSFPKMKSSPINPMSEENKKLSSPIIRLASGVFLSGWVMTIIFIKSETFVMPWLNKILPLLMLIFAIGLMFKKLKVKPVSDKDLQSSTKFLSTSWFFVKMIHKKSIPALLLSSILGVLRTLDQGWTTLIGAVGISKMITSAAGLFLKSHSSILSAYFKFLLLLSMAALLLIILL